MRKGSPEEIKGAIRRDQSGELWTRFMAWAEREMDAKINRLIGNEFVGESMHFLRGEIRLLGRLQKTLLTELIDEVKGGGA